MIKRSYNLTTVMGIPIRMHLTLVILLLFIAFTSGLYGLLLAAGVFVSVALHELGHSWVAIRKGCRVREIMLLPIGGVAKMESIPMRPMDEALMAAAGPAVSFLLALLFTVISGESLLDIVLFRIHSLTGYLASVNTMLGLFNLLPSFPMDGGRIFRAFMTPRVGRLKATELAARIGRTLSVAGGIYGLITWQPMLIIIAIFIYNAAGAEYRAMLMQQMQQGWFEPDEQQADIHVSPPPYARTPESVWKNWSKKTNDFFNDLFKNWQ